MLVAGALGLGAVWRRLRLHPASDAGDSDPAAELRQRLAQTKLVESERPAQEPIVAEEAPSESSRVPLDPGSRRRSVHDRARSAMDELR
jgi:hypothetical protein